MMLLQITTDWTITPTTIVNALAFLAAIGVFKKVSAFLKHYFERKEVAECDRLKKEDEKEDRMLKLIAQFEALTHAFLFSYPTDDQEVKKKLYDSELKEKLNDLEIIRKTREAERKRIRDQHLK